MLASSDKRLKYIKFNCANSETSERLYGQIIKLHGCPNVYINASYPKTKDWKLSSFENIKSYFFDIIAAKPLYVHLAYFEGNTKIYIKVTYAS